MLTTLLFMLMALLSPFAGILLYKLARRYLPGNYVAGLAKFLMVVAAGSLLGLHVICFLVVFRHLPLLGGQFMWLLIAAFEISIFYVALYVNGSPLDEQEFDGKLFPSLQDFKVACRWFAHEVRNFDFRVECRSIAHQVRRVMLKLKRKAKR